jgi:hypothetical protein
MDERRLPEAAFELAVLDQMAQLAANALVELAP